MLIQIILFVGVAVVTFLLGRSTTNARHQAFRRLFLIAFVLVAALAVLFPTVLTTIARAVGVGRGTDLLLYLLVIVFIGSLAMASRRASELSRKITMLTRELALAEARTAELSHASREDEAETSPSAKS